MHKAQIPQDILDRVAKRRGRLHAYETIPARQSALLVIDMQNAYLTAGAPAEIPVGRSIVPNINRIATHMRTLGSPIVWIQNTFYQGSEAEWPSYFELRDAKLGSAMKDALAAESVGHALWAELDTQESDWRFKKCRYSAFHGSLGCTFAERLRAAGIEYLVIVGTATNICCESTARDAMMKNFKAVMISDATATRSDQEQVAALINMIQSFGDVYSTDELIKCIRN